MKGPVYIAGPMTGKPRWNYPAFFQAEHAFGRKGLEIINPAQADIRANVWPPEDGEGLSPGCLAAAMWRNLGDVLTCKSVLCLHGWRESKNARIEVLVAMTAGIEVFEIVEMYSRQVRPVTDVPQVILQRPDVVGAQAQQEAAEPHEAPQEPCRAVGAPGGGLTE